MDDGLGASLKLSVLFGNTNGGILGHSKASESSEGSDELHYIGGLSLEKVVIGRVGKPFIRLVDG